MVNNLQVIFQRRIKPLLYSKTSQRLFSVLAISFTIFLLGMFVWREREVLLNYEWKIDFQAILLAFITYAITLFLASHLWVRIIHTMGAQVNFWTHFRHYCISMLAKRLPGTIWYVILRNQMYQKEGLSASLTTLASGIEYALLLVSGIIVALLFAIPFTQRNPAQLWLLIIVFVLLVVFLHPRVLGWILRKLGKVEIQIAYSHILGWLLGYIGVRLFSGLLVFFIVRILFPLPFQNVWFVLGGWSMAGVITNLLLFFPSNMGITELTMSLVLSLVIPSSVAVIAAVLIRIVIVLFELIWAAISLLIQIVKTPSVKN